MKSVSTSSVIQLVLNVLFYTFADDFRWIFSYTVNIDLLLNNISRNIRKVHFTIRFKYKIKNCITKKCKQNPIEFKKIKFSEK